MPHVATRRLVAVLAILVAAVFVASAQAGDTTSAIIRDVAADGRVDGNYTQAQLRAALASPLLVEYGGPGGVAGVQSALGGGEESPGTGTSGNLPFTGADVALFAIVGGVLVAAGIALRRFGRSRPSGLA
jgi:hypothetical protein